MNRILVLGPLKDMSRIYSYSNDKIFLQHHTPGIVEFPFWIYNGRTIFKLFLFPLVLLVSAIYYNYYFKYIVRERFKSVIIAPESPGLIYLGVILTYFNRKRFGHLNIDYYWSPYLTSDDRSDQNKFSIISHKLSLFTERFIFYFSYKIFQSVSDEADYLNRTLFDKKYSNKLTRISYPCFLVKSKIDNGDVNAHKNSIYFWGSGAPLQGLGTVVELMSSLVEWGYTCILVVTPEAINNIEVDSRIDVRYFKSNTNESLLSFYREVKENALCTLGIFGDSIKSDHVVPNKLVESICLGVPCITKRSSFLFEWLSFTGLNSEYIYPITLKDSEEELRIVLNKLKNRKIRDVEMDNTIFTSEIFESFILKTIE